MAQSFNILTQDLRGEVGKTIVVRQRGEKTFVARLKKAFEDLNNVNTL